MGSEFNFFHTSKYKWVLSLGYGIFLYLFLMAFLPFGVSNYNPQHEYTFQFLAEISIFMPLTIIFSLVNEFGIKPVFKKYSSYGFVIGWTLWSLFFLGVMIFIVYNYLGDWHDWRWSSLPGFVFNTSMVLVFPAIGMFFYFRFRNLQVDYDTILTNTGRGMDEKLMLHFKGEGAKDKLTIVMANFVYAQAQDNYIEIYYLKDNAYSKFLIRSSLSSLLNTLEQDFLVRCHRSYLINLYNVHSIKGNKKDLRIYMSHSDTPIPVSRTYVAATLERLQEYKRFK